MGEPCLQLLYGMVVFQTRNHMHTLKRGSRRVLEIMAAALVKSVDLGSLQMGERWQHRG